MRKRMKKKMIALILTLLMTSSVFAQTVFAMPISVEIENGDTINLDVEPNDVIDTVKTKIQEQTGRSSDTQILSYNGKRLEEGKTLSDYNISENSTIQLTEPETYSLNIKCCNISMRDTICIKYAADSAAVESGAKLLVWNKPQEEYSYGDACTVVEAIESHTTIEGIEGEVAIFDYTGISAKEITEDVYVRLYIEGKDGQPDQYGDLCKYSVLQYAYNKLGKTGTKTTNEALIAVIEDMLNYGALAQEYFKYNTSHLATDNYYKVTMTDGTLLADGSTFGMYKEGETISLKNTDDVIYVIDKDGNKYYPENGTIKAGNTNMELTALIATKNLKFTDNGDGTYSATCTADFNDKTIIIPSEYNGKPVTAVNAFGENTAIEKAVIVEGIKNIKRRNFAKCTNLKTVELPNSLETIESLAFYNCESLESVSLPGGIKKIENATFNGCQQLKSVTLNEGLEQIDESAFGYCYSLESINIPSTVNTIEKEVFRICRNLKEISLPKNLNSIGEEAFAFCGNLSVINYGGTMEEWKNLVNGVSLGSINSNGGNKYTIVCSDGTLDQDGNVIGG